MINPPPYIKPKGFLNSVAKIARDGIPKEADSRRNRNVIGTAAHDSFWSEELYKIVNGFWIGGIWIPGFYYYYINYKQMSTIKGVVTPDVDDLHLQLAYYIEWARKEGKNLLIPKARRKGISEAASTMIVDYGWRFKDGYKCGVAAGKKTYIDDFLSKWRFGDSRLPPELSMKKLTDNDDEIVAGYSIKNQFGAYEDKGTKNTIYARTMHTNPNMFKGLYLNDVIVEEVGEFEKFLEFYSATKDALMSNNKQIGSFVIFGCVCAGTKVWDNKGQLVNIEDLKKSDGVIGYDGNGYVKGKINWMKPPAKKPCYRIETTGGNFIECSNDHPIMMTHPSMKTARGGTYTKRITFKKAEEIKLGDQLAVIAEVPVFGDKRIEYARLLGLLIGDGNYTLNNTPQISLADDEIREYVKANTNYSIYKSYKLKSGKLFESVGLRGFHKTLIKHGIYGQVKEHKRLPSDIDSFDEWSIRELIAGYYDSDGNVSYKKSGNNIKIVLTSISYELLQQVKYLLIKLGIGSFITKENRKKGAIKISENQLDHIFRLYISRAEDVKTFKDKITLLCASKQNVLNRVDGFKRTQNRISIHSVRNDYQINESYPEKGGFFNGKTNMKNIRFYQVSKIEFIGERDIYNLNVSDTHTYIANGFVTANTGGNVDKGSKDFKRVSEKPEIINAVEFVIEAQRFYYFGGASEPERQLPKTSSLFLKYKPYELIGVEDIEASKNEILERRSRFIQEGNLKEYNEDLQNNPITKSEIFRKTVVNNFDLNKLNNQMYVIGALEHPKYSRYRFEWVKDDKGMIKIPYQVIPKAMKPYENGDKCVWILDTEHPRKNFSSLYVAGVDSYDMDTSKTSKSLGAMCVLIRENTISGALKKVPVAVIRTRPKRKEDFYELCLQLAIYYDLIGNTLIDVRTPAVIQYFKERGGAKYLANRPAKFESENSEQGHDYGVSINVYSRPMMVALMQTNIEDYIDNIWFNSSEDNGPNLINELGNYDEKEIGSDNDLADAYGIALMQDISAEAKPRDKTLQEKDDTFDLPEFYKDSNGDLIMGGERPNLEDIEQDHERFGG